MDSQESNSQVDLTTLFGQAHANALHAAWNVVPAPVVIAETVFEEGHHGKVTIVISAKNHQLVSWVLSNVPGARKQRTGGASIICPELNCSLERQIVYATRFALVLSDYGISVKLVGYVGDRS